jgi:hypothetical protein
VLEWRIAVNDAQESRIGCLLDYALRESTRLFGDASPKDRAKHAVTGHVLHLGPAHWDNEPALEVFIVNVIETRITDS